MPLVGRETQLDFLTRQVVTARNIKSGFLNDFLFGGLNYHIEHHPFPTIPRNRLKETKKMIEPFCLSLIPSRIGKTAFSSHRKRYSDIFTR